MLNPLTIFIKSWNSVKDNFYKHQSWCIFENHQTKTNLSMDDSSNVRAVAFYPVDPGSNPRSGSVWDHFVSATHIDGCIMSDK